MVGVAQDDLGAGAARTSFGAETAHDRVGPHRHERRRLDFAVGQRERAGAGGAAVRSLKPKFQRGGDPAGHPDAVMADRRQDAVDLPPVNQVVGRHEP